MVREVMQRGALARWCSKLAMFSVVMQLSGCSSGSCYCTDPECSDPVDALLPYPSCGPGAKARWTFKTGGAIRSSPTVVDSVVYVGSDDGNLYALDAVTGETKWSYQTGGEVHSSPTVSRDLQSDVHLDFPLHFLLDSPLRRFPIGCYCSFDGNCNT